MSPTPFPEGRFSPSDPAFPHHPEAQWTKGDSWAALNEGWDIFECDGSANGPYQICVLEEPYLIEELGYEDKKFPSDNEVWVRVRNLASAGSPLHLKALQFVRTENPKEYEAIQNWVEPA